MKAFNQLSQSSVYKEDEVSVSLTVCGGTYCGGSEVLVVENRDDSCDKSVISRRTVHAARRKARSICCPGCGFSVYENHSQDSRCKPLGDVCETISQKYGTGGNNMPIVTHCIGNGQTHMMQNYIEEVSRTLDCMHDHMAVFIQSK